MYSYIFILGIFIFGGGGYKNVQHAKSHFGYVYLAAGTVWEWPVCEMQFFYYQNPKF